MVTETIKYIDQGVLKEIDELIHRRVHDVKCPGIFATLFNDEKVFLEVGAGQRSLGEGKPLPDTLFRIASCTKSFTIVALLILRDRGLVNLDQFITDFVPEYRQSDLGQKFDPPSLRMLMAMSSGLPSDDPWADRQESISGVELRNIVAKGVQVTTFPGSLYRYSNLGFALLGQVIESVSGSDFRSFVTQEILIPLGLKETGFDKELFPPDHVATGYRRSSDQWVKLPFSTSGAFSCIGGLFSSGQDLRTWVRWLGSVWGAGAVETGPLSISSRRQMQQIVTAAPWNSSLETVPRNAHRAFGYGLGLFVEYDEKYGHFVSHSGGYPGFSSHMRWHVESGLGVVVLENATYSGAWVSATDVLDSVLEKMTFTRSPVKHWTQTLDLAKKADALVRQWNDSLAAEIFEENVDLDIPLDERKADIAALISEVGGPIDSATLQEEIGASDSPVHFIWTIPAAHGAIRCEIRLSPISPILIQTLIVKKAGS